VDGDRAVSRPVAYSLVSGPTHLFSVDADTGVVFTEAALDREGPGDGAYIVGVEAREVGGRDQPATTVEVTIILEVRNFPNLLTINFVPLKMLFL